jgi:hypothetical protein
VDIRDEVVAARSVKDAHKALGLWSIRRALAVAFSGAAVLLVAAWFLVSWLLGSPPRAKAKPLDTSAQLDLIKLVFALVAGIGALVALVTAYRRQRIEEMAGERAERVQTHVEQVAQDNAHDATERRVTDLYGKAVEQLGHDAAAVRLGGLYSLERLAQDHHRHRQTIIDVVCAYLRMPFQQPTSSTGTQQPQPDESTTNAPETPQADLRQELQVRLTAQRLLTRHLNAGPASSENEARAYPGSYWEGMDIDLTGAHFIDLDLTNCRPHHADFTEAQFSGDAGFSDAQFSGDARFNKAIFSGNAGFGGAQFSKDAWFDKAQFGKGAGFIEAQFSGDARFNDTKFGWDAGFGGAQFSREAWFIRARFSWDAGFGGAQFSKDAWFNKAQFGGDAELNKTQFSGDAGFGGAQFSKDAWFNKAQFGGDAELNKAQFSKDAWFTEVQFSGRAGFNKTKFSEDARFDEARFSSGQCNLTGAIASYPNDAHRWPPGWQTDASSADQGMAPLVQRQ